MAIAKFSRATSALLVLSATWLAGQSAAQTPIQLRWQRIGTAAFYAGAPGVATGAVDRVWYSEDGRTLYIHTPTGHSFETRDFENWKTSELALPARVVTPGITLPEPSATGVTDPTQIGRVYAAGDFVYRSEDDGHTWTNLTQFRQKSILGGVAHDIAVSPTNADEITVASDTGVWRSVDGGTVWAGLNQSLPNLPISRLLRTPGNGHGVAATVASREMEWAPGEKQGWQPSTTESNTAEKAIAALAIAALNITPTAVATNGTIAYAGAGGGRLWFSSDAGRTWQRSAPVDGGASEAIFIDPVQPTTALAVLGPKSAEGRRSRILRTINGGLFWDDLTDNLPDVAFHGITADHASNIVYAAGDRGVYFTRTDLINASPATPWSLLSTGLPNTAAMDVRLSAGGTQLYVALDGYGVYSTAALRSPRDVRAVSTADFRTQLAAPGALMSLLGTGLQTTRLGDQAVSILSNTNNELQIQVPFNAPNGALPLAIESASGPITLQMRLANTSPVIFQDPDGSPWLLNADSGTLLDAQHPAKAGDHIQILCTGLGRVRPEWPTGVAAPLTDPPQVTTPLRVRLGDSFLEISRATLAPGYVGYYVVEAVLPLAINVGPAELWLESEGRASNRVRLYLEP